jgi:hypothetical protein
MPRNVKPGDTILADFVAARDRLVRDSIRAAIAMVDRAFDRAGVPAPRRRRA